MPALSDERNRKNKSLLMSALQLMQIYTKTKLSKTKGDRQLMSGVRMNKKMLIFTLNI